MRTYSDFLASKTLRHQGSGKACAASDINPMLFPFQRDLVMWAVRKGRVALFADTGLGKTLMQLEWARLIGGRVLVICPLSVAQQTIREGQKVGVEVHYTRSSADLSNGINITNYEMLHEFDAADFGAVVLDESSILKALDGKTRAKLTEMFFDTPYRLACTATPAPNDIAEIANHAEFLGIMTRAEMLAAFFVHDDDGWRLKGHAQQGFFRWLASWGMSVKKPSDLGYSDDGFALPSLTVTPEFLDSGYVPEGQLFFTSLSGGITERAAIKRRTAPIKADRVADIVNRSSEQWIVWHYLNDEGDMLRNLIPDGRVVEGADSIEDKIRAFEDFHSGALRVLITKPSIAGFGMNFQTAHNMVFMGMTDSWESYYQAVRRQWRFGQQNPVNVQVIMADAEQPIWDNVMRKEREAVDMSDNLVKNAAQYEREEIAGMSAHDEYSEDQAVGDGWRLLLGDSTQRLAEIADDSVGLSVFSPPFASLYTYSPSDRDLGNSKSKSEFFDHFAFIIRELLRVTMPGRNAAVHVQQLTTTLAKDGVIGLRDFRGDVIRAFEAEGWIYYGEVCIDKDPQAQAIRTHSKGLLFVQLRKDSTWSRPALADYILLFRKPGKNESPVNPDITNDEWIEWARPIWYGIKESDTLNAAAAREDADERHICPLQLGTIERCIRLWTNPADLVLSPFAGIGSEGHEAVRLGRQFVGIELKPAYYRMAVKNLRAVERASKQIDLFTWAEMQQSDDAK